MQSLLVAIVLAGPASSLPLPPQTSDMQIPCSVWANPKADTAGVVQVALGPGKDGTGPEGYDGYPVAVKLADNRARTCRFSGTLKLADKMLAAYQLKPDQAAEYCLLLVDLGKKATLHDRKGSCAKALCPEMKLDNLVFPFDPKTKTCTAKRPEGQ